MEKLDPSCVAGGILKERNHLKKQKWRRFLKNLSVELPYDPATICYIPKKSENICPHKKLYTNIHSSAFHNSQK